MNIYNNLNMDLQERIDTIINNDYKKNNMEVINQVKYMKAYYMLLNNDNTFGFEYQKKRLKYVFINIIPRYLDRYGEYSMIEHRPIFLDNKNHYNNTLNTLNRFIQDKEEMDYYELCDAIQVAIISYYKDLIKKKIITQEFNEEHLEDIEYMELCMCGDIHIITEYIENYFEEDLSLYLLGIAQLP